MGNAGKSPIDILEEDQRLRRLRGAPLDSFEVGVVKVARIAEKVVYWSSNLPCMYIAFRFLLHAILDTHRIKNGTLVVEGVTPQAGYYIRCLPPWSDWYNKLIVWGLAIFGAVPPKTNFRAFFRYLVVAVLAYVLFGHWVDDGIRSGEIRIIDL